jgi:integrase/recombinase XerD
VDKLVRPKETKPRSGESITFDEYKLILNEAYKTANAYRNNRDTTLIQTLWETGLRVSDALNLNMNQIDFVSNVLKIIPKKTQRQKTVVEIPLGRELSNKIRTLYALTRRKDGKIFELSYSQARIIIRNYGKAIGLSKPVHPHMFRHGIASYMLNERNVDLKTISKILGHKSITTTADLYVDVTLEKKKKALGINS